MEVTAIFEKDDEWCIAWTEEVPGASGRGHRLGGSVGDLGPDEWGRS